MTGSLTLQVGNGSATTITMAQVAKAAGVSQGAVTMNDLSSYITANASLGVTATVSNGGTLTLKSTDASDPALKVTSNLTDTSLASPTALDYTAKSAYSAGISTGVYGSGGIVDSNVGNLSTTVVTAAGSPPAAATPGVVATIAGGVGASGTKALSGTLSITGGDGNVSTITLGQAGVSDNLSNLASAITAAGSTHGFTAAYNSGTGTLSISQTAKTGAGNADTDAAQATTAAIAANPNGQSTTTADAIGTGGSASAGGIATISYTDKAGTSLAATDLSNQANAQAALTALNSAIKAVAAQDGYIGAQINTLNAVSSVLSTQQENVQSAQNAVQATDYASAASNMSKYEILSQTGISALAQANSQQQMVTKLLQ